MKLGTLRHAIQRIDLGQDDAQRIGVVQRAQECRRLRTLQHAAQFLPHTFGHQAVQLAAGGHLAHQCCGLGRDSETKRCQACHEAGSAQYAHGIFDKGRPHVPQHARLQIARAAIRIEQLASLLVACDRIDGEVAAQQILFQRHRRIGIHHEAAIAAPGLALGTRQRILLTVARMQEHREILPHRFEAQAFHLRLIGTDHHPVAVASGLAKQGIADCAANEIGLHRDMMPDAVRAS